MNSDLREAMRSVADGHRPIPPPPPGLFDRARRAQARRRVASGFAAVVAMTAIGLSTFTVPTPMIAAPAPGPASAPGHIGDTPQWTADVRDAPIDRALVALVVRGHEDRITLVGTGDRYRTHPIEPQGATNWVPSFLLSPDGRHLLTARGGATELLELVTGRSRRYEAGMPVAWSPDGTRIALVDFTGDSPAEVSIVDVASRETLWRVSLPDPGRDLAVAISPDGEHLAVQSADYLYRYGRSGKQWGQQIGGNLQLAGQLAWHPDGQRIALVRPVKPKVTQMIDAVTGTETPETGVAQVVGYVAEQGRADLVPAIAGWSDGTPIINAGNRILVRLEPGGRVLQTFAEGTELIQVAPVNVIWTSDPPGPPDPGPFLQRYRPIVTGTGFGLLILLGLTIASVTLRRRWRPRV